MVENTFRSRFKKAWTAFGRTEADRVDFTSLGVSSSIDTSHRQLRRSSHGINKNTVIIPIYNQIGIDVASVDIRHVRMDSNERFIGEINSELNNCLSLEPNIDQTRSAFFRDAIMSLCELGSIAIVPVEAKGNPLFSDSFDPVSLRIGEILEWYPRHVKVNIYNDLTGQYEERVLPKRMVAIVENPRYAVMNEPNSTLQRLLKKLQLLDVVDDQTSAGKLDLMIQLPYVIKSESRQAQAERRRKDIEEQLTGSKYGIAYIDGTERITQLNRPAENNLLAQVEYLTNMLYGQLGLTPEIIDGTADESAMINYHNRTIEPFLSSITESMNRSFLSRTARTQGQRIHYYRDPFKLVPTSIIAEIADKFTRNEIATSNEIRSVIGWKPAEDPKANELRNSNLSAPSEDKSNRELEAPEVDDSEDISEPTVDNEVSEGDASLNDDLDSVLEALSEIATLVDELEAMSNEDEDEGEDE